MGKYTNEVVTILDVDAEPIYCRLLGIKQHGKDGKLIGYVLRPIDEFREEANVPEEQSVEREQELANALGQAVRDLNQAHDEIVRLQGGDPTQYDWPVWTPQAHTIRWAEKLLSVDMSKAKIKDNKARLEESSGHDETN